MERVFRSSLFCYNGEKGVDGMLEKLFYKDCLRKKWKYDVMLPQEAEAFLNEKADAGYRMERIVRNKILFVKDGDRGRVYHVEATGLVTNTERETLKAACGQDGWTLVEGVSGLQIFEGRKMEHPQHIRRAPEPSLKDVRKCVEKDADIGDISVWILLLVIGLPLAIKSASDVGMLWVAGINYILVPAFWVTVSVFGKLTAKEAVKRYARKRAGEDVDLFCTAFLYRKVYSVFSTGVFLLMTVVFLSTGILGTADVLLLAGALILIFLMAEIQLATDARYDYVLVPLLLVILIGGTILL